MPALGERRLADRAEARAISSAGARALAHRARGGELAPFRKLRDDELQRLDDERIVAYIVGARRARQDEAAVEAARVLAWRYSDRILGFVYNKLGSKGPLVVENIAELTISDAIASAESFAGESIQEFRGWIFQIARFRIVDYHRSGRVSERPLELRVGEGETIEWEGRSGDATVAVDLASVWNQAYSGLSEVHKAVVVMVRLRGLSHKRAAEQVNRQFGDRLDDPMTEENVSQINSRFGKELDRLLVAADHPPPPDDHDD
jgi:DNA-directed RNA polymerase specialized sigma24 family protein